MKFLLNLVAAVILAFGLVNAQADVLSATGTNNAGRVTSVFTNGAYITSVNIANGNGVATVVTLFDSPFAPGVVNYGDGPGWTNLVSITNYTLSTSNSATTYTDILGNTTTTNFLKVLVRTPTTLPIGATNAYRTLGVFTIPAATTTTLDLSANPAVVVYGLSFTNLSGSNTVSASFSR